MVDVDVDCAVCHQSHKRRLLFFLAHWYFIARGIKTKQIGEISGMVIVIIIIIIIITDDDDRRQRAKQYWPIRQASKNGT